jgi:hypothetical protein
VTACHELPSENNSWELHEKLLEFWDKEAAVSRATLERELQRMARKTRGFVSRVLAEFETEVARVTRHPPE